MLFTYSISFKSCTDKGSEQLGDLHYCVTSKAKRGTSFSRFELDKINVLNKKPHTKIEKYKYNVFKLHNI